LFQARGFGDAINFYDYLDRLKATAYQELFSSALNEHQLSLPTKGEGLKQLHLPDMTRSCGLPSDQDLK
jgi:hypothetical protein